MQLFCASVLQPLRRLKHEMTDRSTFLIMVVDSWNYVMEVAGRLLCKTYKRIFHKTQMNLLVPQKSDKKITHIILILFNQY